MNTTKNRKEISLKHLIDASYIPLEVLDKIRDERELLLFSHQLPHWLQRRVIGIKQVFNVNIVGVRTRKERNSGIYTSVVLDGTHKAVICVHKYKYRFTDVQQAVRAYKCLKLIVAELKDYSCISIVNGEDFCADLPDEFYSECPKWAADDMENAISSINLQLNKDSKEYDIRQYKSSIEIVCNKHYVPGGWNFTIYPQNTNAVALSSLNGVRSRIDNLVAVLGKHSEGICSDVAIGVLPMKSV